MKIIDYKKCVAAVGFAALGLTGVNVSAAVLEEVVVTAQKREESLQDVGISVSAFSGEQLESLGVTNTVDITQQIPGMQLFTFSPAFTVFSLRGVSQNNFQDNLEAPVAVYMDGAYIASMNAINAQLFDMERVEVLRGPQGTLYGRNTTGGLVHYITRKADDEEFNGYMKGSVGSYETTGLSKYSIEAAAGGALTDRVRGRLAGRWETDDGYTEAGSAFGAPTATGRDTYGANGYALRGNLQFDVTNNVTVDLTASHAEDNDVPTGQYIVAEAGFDPATGLGTFDGINPNTGNPDTFSGDPITGDVHKHFSNLDSFMDRDTTSLTAQVTAALDNGTEFVSITNWMDMHKFYLEDAGGGLFFFEYNTINDYTSFSQELRLSGGTDRMRWQVGAYYLDMTWNTFQSVEGAAIHGAPATPATDAAFTETFGLVDSLNFSVFGQVEYDIAPQWTLIGGLRYSRDDKNLDMTQFFTDSGQGIPRSQVLDVATDVAIPGIDTIDYDDVAARAQINWMPREETLVYASFSRGIKGGNWSLDPLGSIAATSPANLKHNEEVLHAYELGLKTSLFGGLTRFNASAYYYDYDDYQAFSLAGLTPQVANSGAESFGGEIEITTSPIDGLDLMFGAAFIDSEVDEVPAVLPNTTVEAEFPNSPSVSLNWLGRYEWPMMNGRMAVQIDGNWNGDQFLEGSNSGVSFEEAYDVWNARISYTAADGSWSAAVWAKNFTDTEYRLYNLDIGLLGIIEQVYAPPRQIGGTLSYNW